MRPVATALLLTLAVTAPVAAQSPPDFRQEFQGQFEASARKLVALAEAMPEEAWDWRPMEGVASVGEVYMHIARYNYLYPDQNLGMGAPVAYAGFEEEVTDRDEALEVLATSMDHVRGVLDSMSDEDLESVTRLYGRDVGKWAVLLQLVTHMNEHLGQSIAYARMNGVVPPWSN
ncbi:MAG TPA: DinB family protein [Longimicrobiales bacterium]|nr:DinB family protein [Longimicrobiales bacterium]